MDSDSDNDILTNNVFTFQNKNMTICAKGPNTTNMTNLSFHNKVLSSTMHMPRNMEHSRYASSVYDQRSVYNRREVSPMSVRSAYDFQSRNFNMAHYPHAMSSQRSMINGRSGSPMSMTSTASVSAVDIAMAFKNAQFNKHDLKIITEAYHKFVKRKIRKKFEKRRNLRLFLKGARRRSGGESGEQGSDSSISDDDCRSNKTSLYKENMSNCKSTRTDITNIRRTMQESNIYNDCSANLKQKTFKNAFSIDSGSFNSNVCSKPQNGSILQRDRFKSGFLLPSQRFNKSVAVSTKPENTGKLHRNISQQKEPCSNDTRAKNFMSTDSEQEEIFGNTTVRHKEVNSEAQLKRSLEKDEDTLTPHKKRNKLSPIKKIADEDILDNGKSHVNESRLEFIFAKPSLPLRKSCKSRVEEKLISKSPNVNTLIEKNNVFKQIHIPSVPQGTQEKEQSQSNEPLKNTQTCNTDVSMRPSFIKRKLFTQKLDVAEAKNLSSDIGDNSPKTVYSAIQKEKHKARKLVTNQSCLTRDVLQEDNLLDLIHKIVPAEKINSTSQTNRSDAQRKSKDVEDNWDITSVLSNINNDDVSDTYTDEDIFKNGNKTKDKRSKKAASKNVANISMPKCQVVVEKIRSPAKNMQKETKSKSNPRKLDTANVKSSNISNIKTCAKSFWDTDLESDFEHQETLKSINTSMNIQKNGVNKKAVDQQLKKLEPKKVTADISLLNNTTISIQKFNKTTLGIRSHRVPKKKVCCPELDPPNTSIKVQSKKPQTKDVSCLPYPSPAKNIKPNKTAVPENMNKNGRAIRACRTPKQTTTENTNQTKKTNKKSEGNRTLRSRNSDLSNFTLNDSITTRSRAKQIKKS